MNEYIDCLFCLTEEEELLPVSRIAGGRCPHFDCQSDPPTANSNKLDQQLADSNSNLFKVSVVLLTCLGKVVWSATSSKDFSTTNARRVESMEGLSAGKAHKEEEACRQKGLSELLLPKEAYWRRATRQPVVCD